MLDAAPEASVVKAAEALVARCFPTGVSIAVCDLHDPRPVAPLMAGEGEALRRAIPRRQHEFASGRAAIRQAMAQMGLPAQAVVQGGDRAPIWPAGLCGSLSHSDDICVAVLGRRPGLRSLGVDVEPATPLDPPLWESVTTRAERRWLKDQPQPGIAAKMIFCIKEAAYKAQYPLTGDLFGFDRFCTDIDCATGDFQVRFTARTGCFAKSERLAGRVVTGAGLIVAGLALHG